MRLMTKITLTHDQHQALASINTFLLDPKETTFVLQGYSGTGKSTLVKTFLDNLPNFIKTSKLLNPDFLDNYSIKLTATTNKAAENLQQITGREVSTIHSLLGLRVNTNYKTNTTKLIPATKEVFKDYVLLIDEASYIDNQLLGYIFSKTSNCKIIFIGDPAQLIPFNVNNSPVFNAGFSSALLSQIVRQENNNPIVELSTQFRNTVNTGKFFQFIPDGTHVNSLSYGDFIQEMINDAKRPDWKYADSKILTWTNKAAINYNNIIRSAVQGIPHFSIGEYATCNSFISINKRSIKTDQLVKITGISEVITYHNIPGNLFELDGNIKAFMPKTIEMRNARIKQARKEKDIVIVEDIERNWIDLRAAYAQTINKAQGSTYTKVFIDLNDVGKCNNGNQIARMLYVATSRPKTHLYLTGDLT